MAPEDGQVQTAEVPAPAPAAGYRLTLAADELVLLVQMMRSATIPGTMARTYLGLAEKVYQAASRLPAQEG